MIRQRARESRLPYPTRSLTVNGTRVEEYIIPDRSKAEVLEGLYVFRPVPFLDDERIDLQSGKRFKVRDFRVTREGGHNYLVSPYYEEGGGTVLDWGLP